MNVFAKLQKCRVDLQEMGLEKTGENKFAGYKYFELSDFLPVVNKLFSTCGLFGQISFTSEIASLTVINTDKPDEQIVFTSPMASAALKGCHDIQNVGAVETYQRRYLYTMALEIVESDALDSTTGKEAPSKPVQAPQSKPEYKEQPTYSKPVETAATSTVNTGDVLISAAQKGMIRGLIKEKSIPDDTFKAWVNVYGIASSNDLKKSQASEIIKKCQGYEETADDDGLPF